MKLTTEERKAIFSGDHRALKRKNKPDVKAGDKLILSWTRGGRQIVDRGTGQTIEIPRKPTIWIECMEPELREGGWVVRIIGHDERQPLRLLASTPGPKQEAGLKTRWRNPDRVPKRGEERESWTLETARGYSGSGRTAIDPAEGVDDDCLRTFAAQGVNRRCEFREKMAADSAELRVETRRKQERAVRDRLREAIRQLTPEAQVELMARIELEIRNASTIPANSAA